MNTQKQSKETVAQLVDVGTALAAVQAADTLAAYLAWKRPDLEESILSIRTLGQAIRASVPDGLRDAAGTVNRRARAVMDLLASPEPPGGFAAEVGFDRDGQPWNADFAWAWLRRQAGLEDE